MLNIIKVSQYLYFESSFYFFVTLLADTAFTTQHLIDTTTKGSDSMFIGIGTAAAFLTLVVILVLSALWIKKAKRYVDDQLSD